MRRNRRGFLALAIVSGLIPAPAPALQSASEPDPARVMILGTYHFANPGLDVVQVEVPDILAPEQQEQVRRIVEGLASFRPTRVVVERPVAYAPVLDSLYRAYRDGRHDLGPQEEQQIGFRLARRFDLPRVHPFDQRGEFPFEAVMQYAAEHDPERLAWIERTLQEMTAESNRRHREWTVGEILRAMNDPGELAHGHGLYLKLARIGAGDTQVGATLLAHWYERNIRMFSNLQAVVQPNDRVLVVVGAGHAPILRHLVESDPGMVLADPIPYLPER